MAYSLVAEAQKRGEPGKNSNFGIIREQIFCRVTSWGKVFMCSGVWHD
jgi:hypothetical protein